MGEPWNTEADYICIDGNGNEYTVRSRVNATINQIKSKASNKFGVFIVDVIKEIRYETRSN